MPKRPPSYAERLRERSGRAAADAEYRRRQGSDPVEAGLQGFRSSVRWQKMRALVLAEEPCCRACLWVGRTTAASEVDHVIRLRDRPDLALVRSNLQALCSTCHASKSGQERSGSAAGRGPPARAGGQGGEPSEPAAGSAAGGGASRP